MATEQGLETAWRGQGDAPERFDPETMGGGLMEVEHRARYWWAAQWVAGREVLDAGCGSGYGTRMLAAEAPARVVGVDISDEAVAATRAEGLEAVRGDLRELPFEADSFDVVVCFEAIEHVEGPERVIAELRRVLRSDGVLLISSPNREVYPPGNPHHVHEFLPEELREALLPHFRDVTMYGQHAKLSSAILGPDGLPDSPQPVTAAGIEAAEPSAETYTLAVAGPVPPGIGAMAVLGDSFELRWWHEQVDRVRAELDQTIGRSREQEQRFNARVLELEQDIARVRELEHDLELATRELDETEKSLAIHRQIVADLKSSLSWKLTAPLRAAKRLLR
jgi:SAM-dependent methyltransferase